MHTTNHNAARRPRVTLYISPVSIYNMNTLVTVVIGLMVLSEWKNVQPVKLLVAALLITLGGILAANA